MEQTHHHLDNSDDRIQRALNDAKKEELKEKYGMVIGPESNLPPEVEEEFLSHIEQFEIQYRNSKRVTVREFIGNPQPPVLADILPHDLESELDRLLEILASNDIYLDCICPVENAELYRFITEELLDEEMDDIRIEGMNHHFIYEDFHPNDEYDATYAATEFLNTLLEGDREWFINQLPPHEMIETEAGPKSHEKMLELRDQIRASAPIVTDCEVNAVETRLDGDRAAVIVEGFTEAIGPDGERRPRTEYRCIIGVRKSENGFWEVIRVEGLDMNRPVS